MHITQSRDKSKRQNARLGPQKKQGPPSYASAQALRVLDILRQNPQGVSREKFLTPVRLGGFGITQAGARINELEAVGFIFEHRHNPGEKFITYVLRGEPQEPRKPVQSEPMPAQKSESMPEQRGMFETFLSYETGRAR